MNIRSVQDRILEYSRRLGLGEMRAPGPLDADPAEMEDLGGFKLPANFQQVEEDAKDYENLVKQPGWRKLLDALEKKADASLSAVRRCESNEAAVVAGFVRRWQADEGSIEALERIVSTKILERETMMADLAQQYGLRGSDDVLSEIKVVHQMKNQLKREGMVSISHEEMYENDEL